MSYNSDWTNVDETILRRELDERGPRLEMIFQRLLAAADERPDHPVRLILTVEPDPADE